MLPKATSARNFSLPYAEELTDLAIQNDVQKERQDYMQHMTPLARA